MKTYPMYCPTCGNCDSVRYVEENLSNYWTFDDIENPEEGCVELNTLKDTVGGETFRFSCVDCPAEWTTCDSLVAAQKAKPYAAPSE